MFKVNGNESVNFNRKSHKINYDDYILNIKNVLYMHVDSFHIVLHKYIHNISIRYSIYERKGQHAYYIIYIDLINSNGENMRTLKWTLKDGVSINNVILDFYINDCLVIVENNKFSIYKKDYSPIFTDIAVYPLNKGGW